LDIKWEEEEKRRGKSCLSFFFCYCLMIISRQQLMPIQRFFSTLSIVLGCLYLVDRNVWQVNSLAYSINQQMSTTYLALHIYKCMYVNPINGSFYAYLYLVQHKKKKKKKNLNVYLISFFFNNETVIITNAFILLKICQYEFNVRRVFIFIIERRSFFFFFLQNSIHYLKREKENT
jgi:hypothetical protein